MKRTIVLVLYSTFVLLMSSDCEAIRTILMPYPIFKDPTHGDASLLIVGSPEAKALAKRTNMKLKAERMRQEVVQRELTKIRAVEDKIKEKVIDNKVEEEDNDGVVIVRKWIPKQIKI